MLPHTADDINATLEQNLTSADAVMVNEQVRHYNTESRLHRIRMVNTTQDRTQGIERALNNFGNVASVWSNYPLRE